MKSRAQERGSGSWTKRAILGGLGTAGASIALAAFAASAFANAANPLPDAHGSITLVGNGPAVQVNVGGTWDWGTLSGSSVQSKCDGRSGVAWSVDWWGISNSTTAKPITDGQLTGSLVNRTTSSTVAPSPTTGDLNPSATTWPIAGGGQFHTTSLYNGFDADLCKAPNSTDANGFPMGPWSASATYPSAADVPAKLCVNFYDPHGSEGSYSTSTKDNYADQDDDNSIAKNAFNPNLLGGYCFTPQFNLSMTVDKTNDANQDGTFSKTETAKVAGQDVTFQVKITNTSAVPVVVDSVTDEAPGVTSHSVTCKDSSNNTVVGQTLAVGASVTCTFTEANYAPATNSLTDTVTAKVHDSTTPANTLTGTSTSTVNAPPQSPNVTVAKSGPATGDLNGNGTYQIIATNNGGADSPAQTFTDTLPAGETYVSSTGPGTCSAAGQVVTCQLGALTKGGGSATYTVTVKYTQTGDLKDCATINGQAVPSCVTTSLPNVTVAKSGPATGDLNGNGTYQIVATNSGTADSKATTFTDTLPAGESYVSSTGPGTCSAAGQVVTCQLGVLAKGGGSATYTVTVTYTQTGDQTDCATINGQAVPSCVTTHVDQPSLLVKKTGPATGLLNGNGTYTIVATNSGGADSKATTFTDTLPAGETYVSSTGPGTCSAAGQVVTCNLGVLAKNGGSASYTVTVSYSQTGDLQDCATIAGQANPSCVITHIPKENVTVAKSGPAVGLLNDNGSYTIVATNNGDGPSKAQTFTDTLPDGESYVSSTGPGTCSAAGQVVTCNLPALAANGGSASYTVVVHYTKTGDLTDCATIGGQPVPSCVTTHVVQPNLQVVKTGPATGTLNGNGTYQMVVTNNGNGASQATTFTDTLPTGESFVANGSSTSCSANGQVVTCTVPALAANGGSASYTVVVTYTKTGDLTDCATIAGQPVPSCVTTHIPGQPSITVTKTNDANGDGVFHDTEQANAQGDSVTFKVVITNTSTEPLVIDSVNDAWPGVNALAECPQLIGITLQSGDSVTCTFTVDNYAPAAGDSLTNTITVGGHQPGSGTPVTGTDTSTVTTATPSPIDLAIVKNADKDTVKAGDTLTYTLAVTNVGQGVTTGPITVTDSVPSGLDLVSVDGGTAWDCTIANGTDITCTYLNGALNPGDAAPLITVVTTVNDTASVRVVNTGVVSTPGDVNPANDRSTVKTPLTAVLPIKIVKPTTPTTPTVLPFTGDRTGAMLPVGLMAILAGVFLMVAGRRRRRTA